MQRYSTLQPRAQTVIQCVKAVSDEGVLQPLRQGKCGTTADVHMSHCAPCHLPNVDGTIDPRLVEDTMSQAIMCEVCGTDKHDHLLHICDICTTCVRTAGSSYHTYCLHPPLDEVPEGDVWLCPLSLKEGYTAADVEQRMRARQQLHQQASKTNLYPSAATEQRDKEAARLYMVD